MNAELKTAALHQREQLREIAHLVDRAWSNIPRSEDEAGLLEQVRIFTWALAQIEQVVKREPLRVYGGGLDQPSP